MLFHAGAPLTFWPDALSTATYLLNRRPCRTRRNATPYELLLGCSPDYTHLRVFGCLCYPNMAATMPHKLAPRSAPCIFLGYPANTKGYRCYNPETRRVLTSRHVYFEETVFPFRNMEPPPVSCPPPATPVTDPIIVHQSGPRPQRPAQRSDPIDPVHAAARDVVPSPPRSDDVADQALDIDTRADPPSGAGSASHATSRRHSAHEVAAGIGTVPLSGAPRYDDYGDGPSTVTTAPPPHHMVTRSKSSIHLPNQKYAHTASVQVSPPPSSVRAAMHDPEWLRAMEEEFQTLQLNRTWTLIPRPKGANVITGKWIFKNKLHPDGSLDRKKARWVVRGFS
jgi:hypothetical protein